ncbi:MAG: hypothetical protein ABJO02_04320 [Reichenbachiella sp.]|uniref:hypothetical protein n=1 Tax=Reichenbachiella sp. TaxID=2184521 RepID=UPI003297577E
MKLDEQLVDLISDGTSQEELDKWLKKHPGFEENKELYYQIILAIQREGEKELRSELDEYLKDHLRKSKRTISKYIVYSGIAASISLIGLFYYFANTSIREQEPIQLKIESTPIRADSASFGLDSLYQQSDSIKIIKK